MPQLQEASPNGRTFDVDVCLGRGGFGEVYRARMKQPGGLTTTVALKVLLAGIDATSQPVERLRDEGRLLAALEHPVIMRAIDITVLDGRVALVAEYIDGQDLTECCRGEAPVSQRGLAHVIGEIASALDKAWSTPVQSGEPMRLVHRDIKPSNIRIGRHGEVKLLDFGIARSDAVMREARTATQMVVGSLQYMAPERFSERPLGPEADVFALGCCLFEGLSGQLLFARIDPPRALRLALDREQFGKYLAGRLRALRKDTDPAIIALMEHCLAHTPEDRPTAAELVERCDVLSGELPGPTLRSWARARDWPEAAEAQGPLTGRMFTETLSMHVVQPLGSELASGSRKVVLPPETAAFATPDEPFSPPMIAQAMTPVPSVPEVSQQVPAVSVPEEDLVGRSRGRMARMALGVLLLAGLATTSGMLVMGGALYANGDDAEVEDDVAQPVDAAPSEEAPVEVPVDDVPTEAPDPVTPAPTMPDRVGKLPIVQPHPEAGTPDEEEAAPQPEAPVARKPRPAPVAGPGMGTVRVNGEQRVILRANGVDHKLGQIPAGRYVVYVDFGNGAKRSMTVEVVAGEVLQMKCNTLLSDCIYD